MSRDFRFKQFSISQENAPMKVGTDGVLLGAWCNCADSTKILDVGTGTGLIALMLAQRNPKAHIHAIEINLEAHKDAEKNILESSWSDRIKLKLGAAQELSTTSKYNLIVSNPPFFQNDLVSPDKGRTAARHAENLDLNDFVNLVDLLTEDGVLAGIYPVEEFNRLEKIMLKRQFVPRRKCQVIPRPHKPPHRVLFEFVKRSNYQIKPQESHLIIEDGTRHSYTQEYKTLTSDFYLNL